MYAIAVLVRYQHPFSGALQANARMHALVHAP